MERYNVDKYLLDEEQSSVIYSDCEKLLVVAGAGSGKSLTIVGKIKYLIENKNINPKDILCISFTNDSVKSLKEKLDKYKVDVKTFHKLGLDILVETDSNYEICEDNYLEYICYEFFYGIIFESNYIMKIVLNYYDKYFFFDVEKAYIKFINNHENKNKFDNLVKTIVTFIKLFKTNNYDISSFLTFHKKYSFKSKKLLLIIINIYLIYMNELNSNLKIDFDDMLIKAYKNVYKSKISYKYIIIDEYQDTSYIRFLLINNIIKKTNAKLLCVGDDFQSIYRFSGCDLNIFLDFKSYYKNSNIMFLNKTYRNSNELIKVAGSFVMKNKYQIKKNLISDKRNNKPIKICYLSIERVIDLTNSDLMILGRNNNDIYKYFSKDKISDNIINYNNRNIKYYTVHKSKGLECDNVIVINLVNSVNGFPSNIKSNKILNLVSKSEIYPYDEERRLFYVALTRTKNNVYLLTEKYKESIFILELLNDYKKYIEIIK